jgi:4-alpha-glucanotransferase
MSTSLGPLESLAALYGVQRSYVDIQRKTQTVSQETILHILRALGADVAGADDAAEALARKRRELAERGLQPVIVVWDGAATGTTVTLPAAVASRPGTVTIDYEDGGRHHEDVALASLPDGPVNWSADPAHTDQTLPEGFVAKTLTLPAGIPQGYHNLRLDVGDAEYESHVISAPTVCYSPTDRPGQSRSRYWGVFLPLYSLVTRHNWGVGNFRDLEHLADWTGDLGGSITGTLPLLATYLREPCDPSPYSPVSRLFWNEFYIDVPAVADVAVCPRARELLASDAFQSEVTALSRTPLIRYEQLAVAKRDVLELLAEQVFADRGPRYDALMERRDSQPLLDDYARFRAAQERLGSPWTHWPAEARAGNLTPEHFGDAEHRYHLYAQLVAAEQLEHLSKVADQHGAGLYLDLPLGVRPDGYDAWRNQTLFVLDAHAGAPPDALFTKGQDWGFAPLHPEVLREEGYRHVRQYLDHHLKYSRQLRIDHVMGLHRLYWIPKGVSATQGTYVRYRSEEWYAVLSLASHRHRACIIGENLGTVPPEVDEAMDRHAVRRMFVVQYQLQSDQDDFVGTVPRNCIACINTHDMPPFAAWWEGHDILDREDLGLINADDVKREQAERVGHKRRLVEWLKTKQAPGHEALTTAEDAGAVAVVRVLTNWLATSPAEFMLVNVEDLWGETRSQNVPGTFLERPNWRRRAARTFEEFKADPEVAGPLREINRLRGSGAPP